MTMIIRVKVFPKPVSYLEALEIQNKLVQKVIASEGRENYLLLLEHEPVYTIGRREPIPTDPNLLERLWNKHKSPVIKSQRGGQWTWHGPGQIVIYPILNLKYPPFRPSITDHVCLLQKTVQNFLLDEFKIKSMSLSRTGVWCFNEVSSREDVIGNQVLGMGNDKCPVASPSSHMTFDYRKIAFIGLQVQRWVTSHGISINVTRESELPFKDIIVCGMEEEAVTSIEREFPGSKEGDNQPSPYSISSMVDPFINAFKKTLSSSSSSKDATLLVDFMKQEWE